MIIFDIVITIIWYVLVNFWWNFGGLHGPDVNVNVVNLCIIFMTGHDILPSLSDSTQLNCQSASHRRWSQRWQFMSMNWIPARATPTRARNDENWTCPWTRLQTHRKNDPRLQLFITEPISRPKLCPLFHRTKDIIRPDVDLLWKLIQNRYVEKWWIMLWTWFPFGNWIWWSCSTFRACIAYILLIDLN